MNAFTTSASSSRETPGPPPAPSFARALAFWLKFGFISFGGPAGQIAIMHRVLVEQRRWISERRFLHALNYCMHGGKGVDYGAALIDDDTPTPSHARFNHRHTIRVTAVVLVLAVAPLAALAELFGGSGVLTQVGWFFTKAALVIFGGACAVLPDVVQGAVNTCGWPTPTPMIHGRLALGETTRTCVPGKWPVTRPPCKRRTA